MKTTTKTHTPGPWEQDSNSVGLITADIDGMEVCFVDAKDRTPAENEANARLISSAPEMLEALQGILDIGKRDLTNPKYDGFFASAEAAIQKAKGGQ
jgi:hypothetical protein